jgi:hypothetical protein
MNTMVSRLHQKMHLRSLKDNYEQYYQFNLQRKLFEVWINKAIQRINTKNQLA